MCLVIDKSIHGFGIQPIRLVHPMIVYKTSDKGVDDEYFVPQYYSKPNNIPFRYRKGVVTSSVRLQPTYTMLDEEETVIEEGYHSYVTYEHAMNLWWETDRIVGKFLIPSGTFVYFGRYGEIVSEQLIYLGKYVDSTTPKTTLKKKLLKYKTLFKIWKRNKRDKIK